MEIRTRFAPSPTGYLHIGGLRTALYAYLFAKKNGGKFILRIEDTDLDRYVEGATEVIYSTLRQSGLSYDEGPDAGGDYGPYIQSQRREIYRLHAEELIARGGAYRCFCTRERLEGLTDQNGQRKYDKHCLKLSEKEIAEKLASGAPYVVRQNIPESGASCYTDLVYGEITVENKDLEDNILVKSDGMPTYNFANVVDDRLMKINYVIRGTEYLSSTPKYNLIYDSFGWERPNYIHLPPVMRDAQHKLSKRYGDPSYNDLINEGFLKDALINYIALLGWSPKDNREKLSFDELKELFTVEGLSKSPAIFDKTKLRWLNGEYIKELPFEVFHENAVRQYEKSKVRGLYDYVKLSKLLQSRVETFADIPEKINFLEEFGKFDTALFRRDKLKVTEDTARLILPKLMEILSNLKLWDGETLHAAFGEAAAALSVKGGQVMWCARIAVTGRESTPGGAAEMAEILGRERTLERLTQSMALLG